MNESQLKKAVIDYLTYQQNQGKLYFDRLNSGSLLAKAGDKVYRVELCREGTADLMVLKYWEDMDSGCDVSFLELKSVNGRQTKEQKEFQEAVEAQGAEYYLIRSVDEVIKLFE